MSIYFLEISISFSCKFIAEILFLKLEIYQILIKVKVSMNMIYEWKQSFSYYNNLTN